MVMPFKNRGRVINKAIIDQQIVEVRTGPTSSLL